MTSAPEIITLPKTRALYVALLLLVVFPAIGLLVFAPAFGGLWCRQFEMPGYETQFGFQLGTLEVAKPGRARYSTTGVVSVTPGGVFARAGIRAGDVPRMHHGIGDFCGDLAAAAEGREATLSLRNVTDTGDERRDVRIRLDK